MRDRIPGLPEGIWVPDVQPSRHVAGRAYAVAEDHRRGDWTPYLYVTEDHGESWSALATDGIDGFVHAIEEDPENPDLLFIGTEFGLRVSVDRGQSWEVFQAGVPVGAHPGPSGAPAGRRPGSGNPWALGSHRG